MVNTKKLFILLFIYQQLPAMDKRMQSKPIEIYRSVIPTFVSGNFPSLKIIAAQKIYDMKRRGELNEEQLSLLAYINELQGCSPDALFSNKKLGDGVYQMRKTTAEQYALDLSLGRIERFGRNGRVKQKVLALEIKTQLNR